MNIVIYACIYWLLLIYSTRNPFIFKLVFACQTCVHDLQNLTFIPNKNWIHYKMFVLSKSTCYIWMLVWSFVLQSRKNLKTPCYFDIVVPNMIFILTYILLLRTLPDPMFLLIFTLIYHTVFVIRIRHKSIELFFKTYMTIFHLRTSRNYFVVLLYIRDNNFVHITNQECFVNGIDTIMFSP